MLAFLRKRTCVYVHFPAHVCCLTLSLRKTRRRRQMDSSVILSLDHHYFFFAALPRDTKLISKLEDANDWPTWNQQHHARTHTAPQTDGLQDHTSTSIPLSHSMCLQLFLCHRSDQILLLSQSVLVSNSWYLTLSVLFCSIHCLTFCLPVFSYIKHNTTSYHDAPVITSISSK